MKLVKELLELEGWLVETESNGVSALRKLARGRRYDVIVTDNSLPGLCGLELIRRVRKMQRHERTPIIMLSGNPYQSEAEGAGADRFLRKPEDVFALPQVILGLLKDGARGTM